MSTEREPSPLDSTIIRRGTDAARLSELADFVADLEQRSFQKLGAELPGLLRLSERKRDLVRQVLRRRLRNADDSERESFRTSASRNADPALDEEIDALLL